MSRSTASHPTPLPVRSFLAALFFATGISGLGYQVLWAKMFAAGIGHEFPAVLAVVTAFMAGMAAGALLHDHFRFLQSYARLEIAIGLWAAATTLLIPRANTAIITMLGVDPHPLLHWFVVFGSVFVVLLPATAAMGATLPAIQRLTATFAAGRTVGLLYSANTAGAMLGALAAAFWLMPNFGIRASILIFAAINLLCGIIALRFASPPSLATRKSEHDSLLALRLIATGFLGIGFEIVMIRGLSQVLENTVFTFAALLAMYLLATASGAALYHRLKRRPPLDWQLAAVALACVCGGITLRVMPEFYGWLREHLGASLFHVALAELAAAAAVFFLPAALMGATFTALAENSLAGRPTLSWSAGLNTAGAALAPALTGLLLLPAAGLQGTIAVIACGYALLMASRRLLIVLPVIALLAFLIPSGRDLLRIAPGERVLFFQEGAMAATSVIEQSDAARVLKVNNRFQMGGTAARTAEERHADIPLLLHPAPRTALFIGLGTGITRGAARYYPNLRADGVELLPEVLEAAPLFGEHTAPGALHLADGRRFVLAAREEYDVVVADLFHPAQDGAGLLYTAEHFAAVRQRLAPGGVFCQWLPLFQMDLATVRVITRTFLHAFPEAEAWLLRFNVDTPVLGLIARQARPLLEPGWVERRLDDPGLAAHLKAVNLADSVRLLGCFLAGPEQLRDFSRDARLNTDDLPLVMFEAPRLAFQPSDRPAPRLLELIERWDSERSLPARDPQLRGRAVTFIAARDLYLQGLSLESEGNIPAARSAYLQSVRRGADFTASYARLLALATAAAAQDPRAAEQILEELIRAQPDIPVARQLLQRLKR